MAQARRRAGDLPYGGFKEARKRGFGALLGETEEPRNDDDALVARFDGADLTGMDQPPGNFTAKQGGNAASKKR